MSDPTTLLKAAVHALKKEKNPELAKHRAQMILDEHPESTEAGKARHIIELVDAERVTSKLTGDEYSSDEWDEAAGKASTPQPEVTDDYPTGRGVAAFVGFMGWVAVILGLILVLVGAQKGGIAGTIPGLGITIAGFVQVMIAQLATATFDNANYTKHMVTILKSKR